MNTHIGWTLSRDGRIPRDDLRDAIETLEDAELSRKLLQWREEGRDIVRRSISNPIPLTAQHPDWLPIHSCVQRDLPLSLSILLEEGADPDSLILEMGMLQSARHLAERSRQAGMVGLLRAQKVRHAAMRLVEQLASQT